MRFVYLHGFASSLTSRKALAFQAAFDERGVSLEIPDLDGGDFEHLTISRQLAVVEDLLRGAAARLVRSSMGGYLAALYSAAHPEVERVVLLAPAFGLPGRWEELIGTTRFAKWQSTDVLEVFHYGDHRLRSVRYALFRDSLLFPAQPEAHQPTVIFHGLRDSVVPIELARSQVRVRELNSDHELVDARLTAGATFSSQSPGATLSADEVEGIFRQLAAWTLIYKPCSGPPNSTGRA